MDDVIDPCADEPDNFFFFISDGTIEPRPGLSQVEHKRYSETLRVFQLADAAFLVDSRRDAVKPYQDALDDLKQYGVQVVREYIARKLSQIAEVPFESAIRHFLTSYAP